MQSSHDKRGFSLLEVMIAVVILAMSFGVLIGVISSSITRARAAEDLEVATMLARQKMTEIGLEVKKDMTKGEFPEDKEDEEDFKEPFERFHWKMTIKRVELPAPIVGEKGSIQETVGRQLTEEISKSVRELKLTVSWKEAVTEKEKSFDVTTHLVKM